MSTQLEFFTTEKEKNLPHKVNGAANKLGTLDRPFHDWYRFVLSFPPHLVREYIKKFNLHSGIHTVLDPFCGTGTTIVEAKLLGIDCIGIEANPMAHFASRVKVDWSVNPNELLTHAAKVAECVHNIIEKEKEFSTLRNLPAEAFALLLKDSISSLPLHKSLILLEQIKSLRNERCCQHELLALAKTVVFSASNLHFGPEVGVNRNKKDDAPVVETWLSEIETMANDLCYARKGDASAMVYHQDARQLDTVLKPASIDAVFTSPPYPNEKDYTRTTRLESVLLGFIANKEELRYLKKTLLRSNTRNVYKGDEDDIWIAENEEIQNIADAIEKRRIELGKTSGFEKLYGKVTKLYFGGMTRHLANLRLFLKPGAYLGYVVGDQASYLRIMIRTAKLLADIARSLGYEIVGIDLFRTRFATATKQQMNEEIVVLRWLGDSNNK